MCWLARSSPGPGQKAAVLAAPALSPVHHQRWVMKTRAKSRIKKKDTKKPLGKKQRGTSVGSIATNLREGSRSEYLAQYVFSSFGTAVPVPHQEDTGLDIYCTLLERDGPRAWPRAYYSVQVKSTMEPWIFSQSAGLSNIRCRSFFVSWTKRKLGFLFTTPLPGLPHGFCRYIRTAWN